VSASKSLSDLLDEEPMKWDPGPGNKLIGVVEDVGRWHGDYGACLTVTIREDGTGQLYVVYGSRTCLRGAFEKRVPVVGERIGLKYAGLEKTRDGVDFHKYAVRFADEPTAPEGNAAEQTLAVKPTSATEPEEDAAADSAAGQDEDVIPF
jgi:hypothetical protein